MNIAQLFQHVCMPTKLNLLLPTYMRRTYHIIVKLISYQFEDTDNKCLNEHIIYSCSLVLFLYIEFGDFCCYWSTSRHCKDFYYSMNVKCCKRMKYFVCWIFLNFTHIWEEYSNNLFCQFRTSFLLFIWKVDRKINILDILTIVTYHNICNLRLIQKKREKYIFRVSNY